MPSRPIVRAVPVIERGARVSARRASAAPARSAGYRTGQRGAAVLVPSGRMRPMTGPVRMRALASALPGLASMVLVLGLLMPRMAHAQLTGEAAQPSALGDGAANGAASSAAGGASAAAGTTPRDHAQPDTRRVSPAAALPGLPGLRLAPQLQEHPLAEGQTGATFTMGDKVEGAGDQRIAIDGRGELRRSATVIKGDKLRYDGDTDMADAYGNVHVDNSGNYFVGPEAHLRVGATEGYILSPTYHFTMTGGSGKAERIDVVDNERSKIVNGTYTACQCESDPAWYVRASRFDIDSGTNEGIAHNGVLMFQGVPIFASPYLSFPLSNDRQSGFLPPTMALSSTTGFDVTAPYYFNLAPNHDLTLYPRLITRRGVQLSETFRYLSPNYSGVATAEYLPYDEIKKTQRYAIYLQHTQDFGGGFGGYINYNRVSDSTYPQDLSSTNILNAGVQQLYQQEAGLTYNHGPWSVLTRVQHWQTLPSSIAPYGREPELNVKYQKYDVGGFDFGAEADYTRFKITTADMTEGQRIVLNPYISYPIIRPGYFIVPKVQYHLASYDLSTIATNAPPGQPRNLTESIPTASFDTGLIFERPVHLFGQDFIQTLEPRLFYVYTPYRNQNFAPLFDTAESDFGLAEIFTENTFVGNDRIADANRLTAAISTRFLNPATGDERARFIIAQQYYFRNQQVTFLPNQTPAEANHSDLIAGMSLKLGAGFATETAVQYNSDNNQLVRSNVGFAYSPQDRKVVNVAYRYTRANTTLDDNPINQAVISAQWPITRRLYGVGRLNYDINGHRVVDGLVGFQYDADCWAVGVALQRYANGGTVATGSATGTRILGQLELKGFSTVDNGLVQAFRASIPGYVPPPPPPPPQSRFSNYE
jgi:LPS-assembly protein